MKETHSGERPSFLGIGIATLAAGLLIISMLVVNSAEGATTISSTSSVFFVVSSDKPSYAGNATIVVSGISPPTSAVTITISNPRHLAVASTPATVAENSSFSATFRAGGPTWSQSGTYTIVAVAQQPDNVAAPPTTNSTFLYTAATITQTSSAATSSTTTQGIDSSTLASITGIVLVIVVAIALVGFMLRSRGRGRPPGGTPGT